MGTEQENKRFEDARKAYQSDRNVQRQRIIEALRANGWGPGDEKKYLYRQGSSTYTSVGNLNKDAKSREDSQKFDLTTWKWIETHRENVKIFVSLQVLDQDSETLQIHALVDRIGLEIFLDGSEVPEWKRTLNVPEYHVDAVKLIDTGYTLPLSKEELDELIALIDERVAEAIAAKSQEG